MVDSQLTTMKPIMSLTEFEKKITNHEFKKLTYLEEINKEEEKRQKKQKWKMKKKSLVATTAKEARTRNKIKWINSGLLPRRAPRK